MFNKKELAARKHRRCVELGGVAPSELGWDAYAFQDGPQAELKARLNAWLNWVDPGEPVHWRGL